MRYLLLLILLFIIDFCQAQIGFSNLQTKSTEIFYYKTNALLVEKYLKWDSIPVQDYLSQTPFLKPENYINIEKDSSLPVGHYIELRVVENKVVAEIICKTNLVVYPLPNKQQHIIELRDKQGNYIPNAKIFVNDRLTNFNADGSFYSIRTKKIKEENFIKVYTKNDTCFLQFDREDERRNKYKTRFKYTKLGRTIFHILNKVVSLFKPKRKPTREKTYGYVLLNQPKYKIADTVRLKAYLLNYKQKEYTQPITLELEYYNRKREYKKQFLAQLSPITPSAFVYDFVLRDTLENDLNYTLVFRNAKTKNEINRRQFKVEDYVLDEVTNYNFSSSKKDYFKGDSLQFFAEAKDANGLPILDGKAKLILLSDAVESYPSDSLYVADTLFVEEKKLVAEGKTIFTIANSLLPKANIKLHAKLLFINSSNEIHTKTTYVSYTPYKEQLLVKEENDSIVANYMVNGISTNAVGELDKNSNHENAETQAISFPFKQKIDHLFNEYKFTISKPNAKPLIETVKLSKYDRVNITATPTSINDSVGFVINNPTQKWITYLVFDGNKIIASNKTNAAIIVWKKQQSNLNKMLKLKYYYLHHGSIQQQEENMALLHKMVQIKTQQKQEVYPGQKDSITITVKDYLNKPVKKINLTAFAVNSQFANSNVVPDPPYLHTYKSKKQRNLVGLDEAKEDVYFSKKYDLYLHPNATKIFGLDSFLYYQLLFPKQSHLMVSKPTVEWYPQLAVHCVNNGNVQPIYLLYINRRLVYNSNVQIKMPYSFLCTNTYNQIMIRLKDKLITIDSIYTQPQYKHNLVIDINNLPAKAVVTTMPENYTNYEIAEMESTTLQIDANTPAGYFWQRDYMQISTYGVHGLKTAGPFYPNEKITFYQPFDYTRDFKFEPNYITKPEKTVIRLEKNSLYPSYNYKNYGLQLISSKTFVLNDTILPLPKIELAAPKQFYVGANLPYEKRSYATKQNNKAKLIIQLPKDSAIHVIVVQSLTNSKNNFIAENYNTVIQNLEEGLVTIRLITPHKNIAKFEALLVKNTSLYINFANVIFEKDALYIDSLTMPKVVYAEPEKPIKIDTFIVNKPSVNIADLSIKGKVIDRDGKMGIAGVSVVIKEIKVATSTNNNGEFSFYKIKAGKYHLQFSTVGYETTEKLIELKEGEKITDFKIAMNVTVQAIQEVVVVGYGSVRKKAMTGSVVQLAGRSLFDKKDLSLDYTLEGRVPGLQVNPSNSQLGSFKNITIRGMNSLTTDSKPLFVIDGIISDKILDNYNPADFESIEILKDAAAIALYGSRGANGVIVLTTKNGVKNLRTIFRDYAYWQPNLITNEDGEASFSVTYPDNIISWLGYVVAMDKKKRIGKYSHLVKAYKPVMAQLSNPTFLLEGDSAALVTKLVNYTNEVYTGTSSFEISSLKTTQSFSLQPQSSIIKNEMVVANADTLKPQFGLQTTTNFKDAEQRKIPILPIGTLQTDGKFVRLLSDSLVQFNFNKTNSTKEMYITNNTFDIWLKEIENLKKYPYFCMEQTASKLVGLLQEQKIKQVLNQQFTEEKQIDFLLQKLQKAQQFNGGWAWWENGNSNAYITNYVLQALLQARSLPLVETNIRNGLLFLENNLGNCSRAELLQSLVSLSEAKHVMNYQPYLQKLPFDSLSLHEQWLYTSIVQNTGSNEQPFIEKLLAKVTTKMLGGMYWGTETYRWYNNSKATTLLAYKVFSKNKNYSNILPQIETYFLQNRSHAGWSNTVESASIVSTLLPSLIEQNKSFVAPTSVTISGDTSFTISQFPSTVKLNKATTFLQVSKPDGGLSFITAYEQYWNKTPEPVQNNFVVNAFFKNNYETVKSLKAGEIFQLHISVTAKAEAEFVMIEIPIPAGCVFANKASFYNQQYFKNKVVLFIDNMKQGDHNYEFSLQAKYAGKYTINPTKVELMYFPTFYGRNELKKVGIE